MSRIRATNTKPELRIGEALRRHGYRFVLHDTRLPGKPDIVFPRHHVAVQVRGCFWHGHTCIDGHQPKSRVGYWGPKLAATKERDARNDRRIRRLGWKLAVVWECRCMSARSMKTEVARIVRLLEARSAQGAKR